MLFVVESSGTWVKLQELSQLVTNVHSELVISSVLQPNLQKSLLCTQTQTCSDDQWLLELLSDQSKEDSLPHLVNVVVLPNF
jgi:hypothetical protein